MHIKQLESVFRLDAKERYGYLIRKVADFEQVFLIVDENGEYIVCGTKEMKCIPVWPEFDFAKDFLKDEWGNYNIVMLELSKFIEWMDDLENGAYSIGGFPNKQLNSIIVNPLEFKSHLMFECGQYE